VRRTEEDHDSPKVQKKLVVNQSSERCEATTVGVERAASIVAVFFTLCLTTGRFAETSQRPFRNAASMQSQNTSVVFLLTTEYGGGFGIAAWKGE
jgi:hypothetical protein